MRNAMVMPTVLIITLLISILIGTYMMNTSVNISREFQKDLAEVRGYWGAYGAKELKATTDSYTYKNISGNQNIYTIEITGSGNQYSWELITLNNSGIKESDLYLRTLEVEDITDAIKINQTKSYAK